jgi:hypothetical protein
MVAVPEIHSFATMSTAFAKERLVHWTEIHHDTVYVRDSVILHLNTRDSVSRIDSISVPMPYPVETVVRVVPRWYKFTNAVFIVLCFILFIYTALRVIKFMYGRRG